MNHGSIITITIALLFTSQLVTAGEITDTYNTGETLTATTLTNIKDAVNDNNTKINAAGDITSVAVGSGLIGGGTSGAVSISVGTGVITGSHIATGTITGSDIAGNSVPSGDLSNEAGIEFSTSQSTYSFTLVWQTVETLTVTAPSIGYVHCTAQGFIWNVNGVSGNYNIFGWDHNNTAANVGPDIQNWSNQGGVGNVYTSITSSATYSVSAGTNTFSFKIRNQQGLDTSFDFFERGYSCMYFPTRY